jgi:hypothetical protein
VELAAKFLMMASAGIILLLGILHLIYTFHGPKLLPRDPALQVAMKATHPVITRQTTMWRAWMGFNASHSMGAILFGLIYGFMALYHAEFLFHSVYLLAVGFVMLVGLFVLGKIYWFRVPLIGITISLACYVISILSAWA